MLKETFTWIEVQTELLAARVVQGLLLSCQNSLLIVANVNKWTVL